MREALATATALDPACREDDYRDTCSSRGVERVIGLDLREVSIQRAELFRGNFETPRATG